jgi:hypothetical protein
MGTAIILSLKWLVAFMGSVGLLLIFAVFCYLMLCGYNSLKRSWTRLSGPSLDIPSLLEPVQAELDSQMEACKSGRTYAQTYHSYLCKRLGRLRETKSK